MKAGQMKFLPRAGVNAKNDKPMIAAIANPNPFFSNEFSSF